MTDFGGVDRIRFFSPSRGRSRTFLPNLITGRNVDQTRLYVDLMVSFP
jgi:hypothetical protein